VQQVAVLMILLLAFLLSPPAAAAVEYRLLVVNVETTALFHFLDRASGWGQGEARLERLGRALDSSTLQSGTFLSADVQAPSPAVAAAFSTAVATGTPVNGGAAGQWTGVRWDGRPGERAVWVVSATRSWMSDVHDLGLAGPGGDLRYFIPYRSAIKQASTAAVSYPLEFLEAWQGRPRLWERYLAPVLDLRQGLAAVVGVNPNAHFADRIYLVVDQPAAPATFRAVIAWRDRATLGGAPGMPSGVPVSPAR